MKKFIDTVDTFLDDSLRGFSTAHADIVHLIESPRFIKRKTSSEFDKVALISGGGSGHEPLHAGFVGYGMLDAACPGQVFTSPTPDQMLAAAQSVQSEQGVLFIVKNYSGDVMNFEIAAEMLECPCETVIVDDDVALPKDHSTGRRGVAGTLIVEKIVGAAAEQGKPLADCTLLAEQVIESTASMGIALSSCTVPELGQPTFELGPKQAELGVGIHGEHGRETIDLGSAQSMIHQINQAIYEELKPKKNQPIFLHVNGLGATPLSELYLVYDIAHRFWSELGVIVTRSLVGDYTTSLDMAGCSLTVTLLNDSMLEYWDAPVHTSALRWGC
ncbi:MAG: dihydroxyacetone kinase subunit DhaK [Gammaproteobacteria bacterium]|nr:dihydroxyacetone kinase subunit DhaK [Gammaproteobacteria bacterium]